MTFAPFFITDNDAVNKAYRLATADLQANILPFKDGILESEKPVIIAGLGYCTPWTRDAAINTWNAGGIICPDISLNTLKSVLGKNEKGYYIDGEYWDRIIWTVGAWQQYLYTGDKEFLKIAYDSVINSLEYFEKTEFNEELNLFRGPACYGDGVAAYPDIYAKHMQSGIISFAEECKELCVNKGVGIPMYTLSTNCLYYYAYVLADEMAAELNKPACFSEKAKNMKKAINRAFWSSEKGSYTYIYDEFGGCDSQEGIGISFAILFDIADEEKKRSILANHCTTPHGIPCVYPSFQRYDTPDGQGFGRHSGTVWPHVQGFWASAAAKSGATTLFDREFAAQTANALRSMQFAEIYHPLTGEPYGGRQERYGAAVTDWNSEPHQTWSATAYLRNVYMDLMGMDFKTDGIAFSPVKSTFVNKRELEGLHYRNAVLNVSVIGDGSKIKSFRVNGKESEPFIGTNESGELNIEIVLESSKAD